MTKSTWTNESLQQRDRVGLVRPPEHETQLDALWRLMNGLSETETEDSALKLAQIQEQNRGAKPKKRRPVPWGIVEQSEAWNDARICGVPLHHIKNDIGQQDLFEEPRPQRYAIAPEELFEVRSFDGPCPIEQGLFETFVSENEPYRPYAWDGARILTGCPRGICLVTRERWSEGYRTCPGC